MSPFLFKKIELFNNWAQIYVKSSYKLIPKKPLEGFNHYNQSDIFAFKMMASFSLELYFKNYIFVLIDQKGLGKDITSEAEFDKYLKDNAIKNHDLRKLKKHILKEDASFNEDFVDKAVSYFNCFEEIRYPTFTNTPKEIKGLLEYNDDMKQAFHDTYHFLRTKVRSYINHIHSEETEKLEHESEAQQALSEYQASIN